MTLFLLVYSLIWLSAIGCAIDKRRNPWRYHRPAQDDFIWGGVYDRLTERQGE